MRWPPWSSRETHCAASTFSYAGLGQEPVSDGTSLIARAFDGTPLAAKTGGAGASPVSLLQNAHGDVVAATDPATGTVTGPRAYDLFGTIAATTGTSSTLSSLGYQRSWTDPATGLAHAQARWYDPATGAFTSQDSASVPLASATDANGYLYAGANPATYNDPTGQSWWNSWWHDIAAGFTTAGGA
jgi:RHS repeat-associated protein